MVVSAASFCLSTLLLFCFCVSCKCDLDIDGNLILDRRSLVETNHTPIVSTPLIKPRESDLLLYYDPPDGAWSPTVLALCVLASDATATIYYEFDGVWPSLYSPTADFSTPYIEVNTPYGYGRNRTVTIVAVGFDNIEGVKIRSKQYVLHYFVEGARRPQSFGYLVPGIHSGGYFVRVTLEMKPIPRAQVPPNPEFANYYTWLGQGPFDDQIRALRLTDLDPDLQGFEGGFVANVSNIGQYGVLVPYNNGRAFSGKVVRVNLIEMENVTSCLENYRFEGLDSSGTMVHHGTASNAASACILVLNLTTLHPHAKGFKKGFMGYPYGYLSPGEYSVAVRLNMEDFSIETTQVLDLSVADQTLGGYSGGFSDGSWACFVPCQTFYGPVGGIRSNLTADAGHLQPYYNSIVACVNSTAWASPTSFTSSLRTFDIALFEPELRGFSEAIRIGRFAYLTPFRYSISIPTGKLCRIYLGFTDIGTMIDQLAAAGKPLYDIVDVIDVTIKNPGLQGFSGIFNIGTKLFLVPFRNNYEPWNGQRGSGMLPRIDLNNFAALSQINFLNLTITTRSQIPNYPDHDLRGFAAGFASGEYGYLVPYFNGVFSGKVARFVGSVDWTNQSTLNTVDVNLQELDLTMYKDLPGVLRGFRGGFASLQDGFPGVNVGDSF